MVGAITSIRHFISTARAPKRLFGSCNHTSLDDVWWTTLTDARRTANQIPSNHTVIMDDGLTRAEAIVVNAIHAFANTNHVFVSRDEVAELISKCDNDFEAARQLNHMANAFKQAVSELQS